MDLLKCEHVLLISGCEPTIVEASLISDHDKGVEIVPEVFVSIMFVLLMHKLITCSFESSTRSVTVSEDDSELDDMA